MNFTVYVVGTGNVQRFPECNFNAERLDEDTTGDFWITSELIVGLGVDVTGKRAVKLLQKVIEKIEAGSARVKPGKKESGHYRRKPKRVYIQL